ncbi:PREDICTED: E3 ubiquitin-protein ligase FANCL isoform X1 [Papilio xuthus]|uniref:E3 ubiquitin-protein ligase FANCL isoform X1 n=2 Tax=Papilio xuthus TaxID=66420 RepID=A0AAJ7ED39_PAPXU|nr:PREDICTED: E3 ubiquitin-protein ligase FANCL isoform X1 [Papilio xuthus]
MESKKEMRELFCFSNYKSITKFVNNLEKFFLQKKNTYLCSSNSIDMEQIDKTYLNEIKNVDNVNVYFGKTLEELKCVISDDGFREHEIFIKFSGPRKYEITKVNLPHLPYQDEVYNSINEIIDTFRNHVINLSNYFFELEQIDQFCSIMEPLHPTYKDEYRKIALDERTWLHIEVTPDGAAKNIYLIGQSEAWNDKLQKGFLTWDHDKSIIDNIISTFDISSFSNKHHIILSEPVTTMLEKQHCAICLCEELPDNPSVPQPICQNNACGVYYHRSCLYEWLLASAGGRPPAFGVATGSCPTCCHPIACSLLEK